MSRFNFKRKLSFKVGVNQKLFHLECIDCKDEYQHSDIVYLCKKCGGLLDVKYDYEEVKSRLKPCIWSSRPLLVWRYRELLPIIDESKIVSLEEGGTKLYRCSRLNEKIGLKHLYIKNEGGNPTGSFKDRGMTVGVTKALEYGIKTVVCASTGNTSASLAAYAAKAGIRCLVAIPSGKVAYGKLAQAIIYGAQILQVRGNFDEALKLILEFSLEDGGVYLLNSVNPYRLEGQKTIAYEIVEQMNGSVPDSVIVPVGNAGNISAIWKGFQEVEKLKLTDSLPRMVGIQAEEAAPIVNAIKAKRDFIEPLPQPETVATAIRIGSPVNWKKAIRAIKQSNGLAEAVTDKEILEAQKMLARFEGLFTEPAGASSIAGLKKLLEMGRIEEDEVVVCVVTGHGLKDPETPVKFFQEPSEIDVSIEALRKLVSEV